MRYLRSIMLGLAGAAAFSFSAQAAVLAPGFTTPQSDVVSVQYKQQSGGRDCTPYNGPFGFYGNVWCQPPSEQSYMRNLGSRWNMETPPSLRKPKRDTSTDW